MEIEGGQSLKGLESIKGHKQGIETAKVIIKAAIEKIYLF